MHFLGCFCVLFVMLLRYSAGREVEDKPTNPATFCDAVEVPSLRQQLIQCIHDVFPQNALEVIMSCKAHVFGDSAFDEVLFGLCDEDAHIQKWLKCNTRGYKEKGVNFLPGHNDKVEECFYRVISSPASKPKQDLQRTHYYQYQKG